MSDDVQPAEDNLQLTTPLPVRNQPVWIQCEKFRCLARQDADGKWRSVFGDEELTTFVSVIDLKGD